ncbi:MAG: hypothetical protein E4H01_02590 [Lysobacterales bacterium]|nr:MAG: hypothetical protein E4H01_02590 [Xanthomonadales bacterium]
MAKFKVKSGKHYGPDGTIYRKGDTIESDKELSESFPNKFERLALSFGPRKQEQVEQVAALAAAVKPALQRQ